MKTLFAIVFTSAFVMANLAGCSQSAKNTQTPSQGKVESVSDVSVRGAQEGAPEMKPGQEKNVQGVESKKIAPSAAKSAGREGGTSRTCDIAVDNRTPLKIQIFVDDDYSALVPQFGDIEVSALIGKTKLYARADFDTGEVETWGPRYFDCEAYGDYKWTLNRE
ncbi:hypothetical protein KKC45_04255 [Patescibacteria group bacterium]|nr:hypothetical protein [Patescibacteria group bacterium]